MRNLLALFLASLGVLGAGFAIYVIFTPNGMRKIMDSDIAQKALPYLPVLGIILFVLIFVGAFAPLITGSIKNAQQKQHLLQVGQKATAKILTVEDTNITVNNAPYIKMQVEIKPGVTAAIQMLVSRISIPRPGDTIEVLYDPGNPTDAMPAS